VIHAAPNAISMVKRAAMATAHDFLDSMEGTVDGNIRRESGWPVFWQPAAVLTIHTRVGLPCLLHCAKMRAEPA
jgi:hypothetical protein